MRIKANDIVDWNLGDASSEFGNRLRASLHDPKTEASVAEWSAILASMECGRDEYKATQLRAIDGVMARIAAIKTHQVKQSRSIPRRRAWGSLAPSWTYACGAVATVCIALVAVGYLSLKPVSREDPSRRPIDRMASAAKPAEDNGQVQRPKLSRLYVDFRSDGSGDGSADNPYTTLAGGVSAVEPGETLTILAGASNEQLRIDKPIRLIAVGGRVRIGPTG